MAFGGGAFVRLRTARDIEKELAWQAISLRVLEGLASKNISTSYDGPSLKADEDGLVGGTMDLRIHYEPSCR
jgi:hypothetical protein